MQPILPGSGPSPFPGQCEYTITESVDPVTKERKELGFFSTGDRRCVSGLAFTESHDP